MKRFLSVLAFASVATIGWSFAGTESTSVLPFLSDVELQGEDGVPVHPCAPAPQVVYPYIQYQPEGVSDFCWEAYQDKIMKYRAQYWSCVISCKEYWEGHPNDPTRDQWCKCNKDCGSQFKKDAQEAEVDMWLCSISLN